MTKDETNNLLDEFYARFRSVESFHSKLAQEDLGATLSAWKEILSPLPFDDALEAIRRLSAGKEQEPKSFDLFPAYISRIVEKIAKARYVPKAAHMAFAKEQQVACLICVDTGHATVFSKHAMQIVRERMALGITDGMSVTEKSVCRNPVTTVICMCSAGKHLMSLKQRHKEKRDENYVIPPMFNPDKMFPTYRKHDLPETRAEFVEWCLDTRAVNWTGEEF